MKAAIKHRLEEQYGYAGRPIVLDEVHLMLMPRSHGPLLRAVAAEKVLDTYSGVAINASSPYAGRIVDKWINKAPEGNRLSMPAAVKADGNTFEVGVSYKNESSINITGGVEVIVTKPDGSKVAPAIDWSGIGIGQTLTKQYNISKVDQEGAWPIAIRFLAQT